MKRASLYPLKESRSIKSGLYIESKELQRPEGRYFFDTYSNSDQISLFSFLKNVYLGMFICPELLITKFETFLYCMELFKNIF